MTPVRPLGLMLGKILPYFAVAIVELVILLLFMRYAFRVPIHGNVFVLLALSLCYIFVNLALGVLFSARAKTQAEAMQMAVALMLPSIFLSGYIFAREAMPLVFYIASFFVPATYMMNISRGIILRGAGVADLWVNAAVLVAMGAAILLVAGRRFRHIVA